MNVHDRDDCPICAEPFADDQLCATDIDLGICHAACLEGSAVVNLDTGEPSDGPVSTYRYGDLANPINLQGSGPAPIKPRDPREAEALFGEPANFKRREG